ncbi:MAG: histidine kinase [Betaproteobacteria bacterium]|nr:histidine kinase [Betaproteobacteria bacterium]
MGVVLRIVIGVNLLICAMALARAASLYSWGSRLAGIAAWVEPLLCINLLMFWFFSPLLQRLPRRLAMALALLIVLALTLAFYDFWRFMGLVEGGAWNFFRAGLLSLLVAGTGLAYFSLRARALSPAISEARLQALTARIRPHFLFNSLNAVLSLIRSEPRRAEEALEEMADLFRALMREPRELTLLSDEIALCRQYLNLEKLRLGERLEVEWHVSDIPAETRIPPLLVQPLLENAVYHGIEPLSGAGVIGIHFSRHGDELHIVISNPANAEGQHKSGNRMALSNIRERLALYYDLEAHLEAKDEGGRHRVHITLPCRAVEEITLIKV